MLLTWAANERAFPETFPAELPPVRALILQVGALVLGAGAFGLSRGRGDARLGAAFGLAMSAIGFCASRWPQLSRAIELNGGVFAGPFLSALLATALAGTAVAVAAALLIPEARRLAPRLVVLAVVLWAAPTAATEYALTRWWGFGPRSLAEAAGIPSNYEGERLETVRLSGTRGHAFVRESSLMVAQGVSLSPESITKLEEFLERSAYRGIFVAEAMADVRRGWLMWWDADHALDAMMVDAPGRVHPDYRGALDLIKVGPMTRERYDKLERLARSASRSTAGFEDVTKSQYIFEGFAACYARFGEEEKTREWLARLDNLFMVMEKKIEIAPFEEFREGRVEGSVMLDGRPAGSLVVGLFEIWRTTASAPGVRLLSGSTFPDEDGRFAFTDLGPGEYELGLLGRPEDLNGRIEGSPGRFDVGYEHPSTFLPPIRLEREVATVPSFSPAHLPEAPIPDAPEPPLIWRKR